MAWFLALAAGFLGGTFALTGTWFTYVYLFLGLTFIETAGTRKIPGIVVGASTTVVLILAGLVNWPLALAMFVGSGLGAWLGVDLGIKVGEKWVRRLFIILVIISAVKLLFL